MTALTEAFDALIAGSVENDFDDNYDFRRYGPLKPRKASAWSKLTGMLAAHTGIGSNQADRETARARAWLNENLSNFEWFYDRLHESASRRLLIQLLAYRALGHRRIKLPLNTPEYWTQLDALDAMTTGAESIDIGLLDFKLSRMKTEKIGYPMELFMRPSGIMAQIILQQYRCTNTDGVIEVGVGDTVIDAGGCWGDTALYFAYKTGANGKVYSFEFLTENLAIFRRNMAINPDYAQTVELIDKPLWSVSGVDLMIEGNGPGTRVVTSSLDPRAKRIKTLSIDDLIEQQNLQRLDFIKMDIEGAEMEALAGAKKSIQRFRPKLAISVYHRLQDLWEVPKWLDALDLGYDLYLRHFTIHQEETVLFARARSPSDKSA